MEAYEIGKDVADLNMRVSRLEQAFNHLTEQLTKDQESLENDKTTR